MNQLPQDPADALLQLIRDRSSSHCRQIAVQAGDQARERVHAAFHEARQRVARAIADERARARVMLASHEAHLETHDRQQYQDSVQHLLARARHRLDAALLSRWANADSRRQWLEHVLAQAERRLPQGQWTLQHPADLDDAERGHLQARISTLSGHSARLETCTGLRAGLRILAEGACLDGSLEGMLADEGVVQARLLALLESALPAVDRESRT